MVNCVLVPMDRANVSMRCFQNIQENDRSGQMKGLVGEINRGERSGDWLGSMNLSEGGLWT